MSFLPGTHFYRQKTKYTKPAAKPVPTTTFWGTKLPGFFMSSKDAPQKMQFLGTIKKLASLFPMLQNAKWRKTPIISAVTEPK